MLRCVIRESYGRVAYHVHMFTEVFFEPLSGQLYTSRPFTGKTSR